MFKAEQITEEYLSKKIHLRSKGGVTLTQIRDLIMSGDTDCVDDLINTIRATMDAKDLRLHIQAVKRLHGRCVILGGLLFEQDYDRKDEIEEAFSRLSEYTEGISSRLH